jgi:hypothetical protein
MADQIITNETPLTTNQWFACFRLVEQLILAGWTVVESSRGVGDTPAASDRWSGNFGLLVGNAWIILQAASGRQICFRRGGTSTTDGWILWSKGGGFTTGGTDIAPANIPADTEGSSGHHVRGTTTPGTPGTFTTDAPWFGSTTATTEFLNIGCRDATGAGDESFWLLVKGSGSAWNSTTSSAHGRIAYEALERPAGTGIVDLTPYAWWVPTSDTGSWAEGMDDGNCILHPEGSVSEGRWRRWFPGDGARGTITAVAAASIVDGETFVIDDGLSAAVTFEFDNNGSVVPSTTLRPVTYTGIETATAMRDLIRNAINSAPVLNITANVLDVAVVGLVNSTFKNGTVGNVALAETVANPGFIVTGMTGGQDEDFVQYASGGLYGSNPSGVITGEGPSWQNADDRYKYQDNPPLILHRMHLNKVVSDGYRDAEGGWTKNILFSGNTGDFSTLQTAGGGAWAKFGNFVVVWWDGNPLNPPQE